MLSGSDNADVCWPGLGRDLPVNSPLVASVYRTYQRPGLCIRILKVVF